MLIVLLIVFAIYAPSLGNGFAMDGATLAKGTTAAGTPRPYFDDHLAPGHYFAKHYWASSGAYDGLYRPVTVYSFALTYNLLSRPFLSPEWEALPQHLINVLLHLLSVALLFLMLSELGVDASLARLGALLFGVQAIHSEVVAGIIGRAELFTFVFGAGALLLFGRARSATGTGRIAGSVGASVLLVLGFCSKESGLVWIAFLPCFELARGWMRERRSWLVGYVSVVVPALLLWVLLRDHALADVAHLQRDVPNINNPLAHVESYSTRFFTGVKVWGYGLYKCLIPYPLSSLYGLGTFALVDSAGDLGFLLALITIGALLFVMALGMRPSARSPLVFLGVALLLGFSFPTTNLTVVVGTVFGERLWFTPSLGLCFLAVSLVDRAPVRLKKALVTTLLFYCAGNAVIVLYRNPLWKDSNTLARHDVLVQPRSADLHEKAADAYWFADPPDPEKALQHLDQALAIYPAFPSVLLKRGAFHAQRGEWDTAISFYERALRSRYNTSPANRALALRGVGALLFEKNRPMGGLAKMEEAVQIDPTDPSGWHAMIEQSLNAESVPRARVRELLDGALRRFPRRLGEYLRQARTRLARSKRH